MEKEFIDYEIALELKELGFDEECLGKFYHDHLEIGGKWDNNEFKKDKIDGSIFVAAPLYQQAFRWFREKHNLVFNFMSYGIVKPGEYHWSITWNDEAKATGIVKTHEEAELACLKKLIEIVKQK
jgi:hypothetical protein